jgi:hypothetical protein
MRLEMERTKIRKKYGHINTRNKYGRKVEKPSKESNIPLPRGMPLFTARINQSPTRLPSCITLSQKRSQEER